MFLQGKWNVEQQWSVSTEESAGRIHVVDTPIVRAPLDITEHSVRKVSISVAFPSMKTTCNYQVGAEDFVLCVIKTILCSTLTESCSRYYKDLVWLYPSISL